MGLEVGVLGPLEVFADGRRIDLPAPKPCVVLHRLLVGAGGAVTSDALADALWAADPPPSAGKLLQVYVSQLRKSFGSTAIRTVPTGYRLGAPAAAIDANRFARLVADARRSSDRNPALAASLYRQAAALWRGAAYADVADAPFAAAEIARLDELRRQCLEERLAAEVAAGRAEEVLAELGALVAEHPLQEGLLALRVRALAAAGRRADALQAYRAAREVLRDELGLDPGPALVAAHEAALHVQPAAPSRPASPALPYLPQPPTPLLGRDELLDELRQLLTRSGVRFVTLTGAGGSGKTRLALALAASAAADYANGARLVQLAPLRDPQLVASAIAEALGLKPALGADAYDVIAEYLADRELLLVVDNAEHLPAAFGALADLVARAPRLTLLVTSRRVLHVTGEHVVPVPPLPIAAAGELFVQRARAAAPSFAGRPDDDAVLAVCRRVDALPLSVELAAARVALLPVETLLERLGRRLSVLTSGPRDLPARQQTLRETLEWSAGLLSPASRELLARLSAFPGGCSLECAERFVGADLDALAALVDDSMLQVLDTPAGPRFVLLETIREFADGLLGDDRNDAQAALVAFCADLLRRAELRGPNQALWMPRIDAEHDNLRAALDVAEPAERLQLAAGLWRYWWVRGHLAEGRLRLAQALAVEAGDLDTRALALYGAAGLAWAAGDLDDARPLAEAAHDAAQSAGNDNVLSAAHTCLGSIAKDVGDLPTALRHFEEAGAISARRGSEIDVATARLNTAYTMIELGGDAEAAREPLTQVLEYHRSQGTAEGVGFAALGLGEVALRLDEPDEAQQAFTLAKESFGEVGFEALMAYAMQGLAACVAPAEAARLLGAAAAIIERTGDVNASFAAIAERAEAAARAALGDEAYTAAFASDPELLRS